MLDGKTMRPELRSLPQEIPDKEARSTNFMFIASAEVEVEKKSD
jgi:hypothetical protein